MNNAVVANSDDTATGNSETTDKVKNARKKRPEKLILKLKTKKWNT